jgi:hypothetical protein
MKVLFSIFFILFSLGNPTISEIRKLYPNSANSESNATELVSKLASIDINDDKILVAYKGASIAIVSKYQKKVADKIKKFAAGVKFVESAIISEPNNIEIHLIRLSIQENVPKIVKYNKNIKEDVTFILANYKEQSPDLKEYLKKFILQSKSFSTQEKQTIK